MASAETYGHIADGRTAVRLTPIQGQLVISGEELATAVQRIEGAFDVVTRAAGAFWSKATSKKYRSHTSVAADSRLSILVLKVVHDLIPEVKNAAMELCRRLLEHAGGITTLIGDRITRAEEMNAVAAKTSAGHPQGVSTA
jgi:hypothetical protein